MSIMMPMSYQSVIKKTPAEYSAGVLMVGGDGFEPSKSLTTDLQSVPFGRSGIPPGMIETMLRAACFNVEPRIRIERITC